MNDSVEISTSTQQASLEFYAERESWWLAAARQSLQYRPQKSDFCADVNWFGLAEVLGPGPEGAGKGQFFLNIVDETRAVRLLSITVFL